MPAFGGLTIRARWPLPSGLTMLISRWLRFFGSFSRLISSSGWTGVRSPKTRAAAGGLGVDAVDRVDAEHAPVLLRLARSADGAADAIADAEAEAADLARADVDVVRARQQAVPAEEAEALVDDVEDAAGVGVAGALGLALEDPLDEVVLALLGAGLELEVAADRAELGDAHLAQVGDVEVVPLAGGLQLLLLLELRDRGAGCHLVAAARPPIPGTLIGTELGHGREVPQENEYGRGGPRPGWVPRGIAPLRRPVWDAGNDTRRSGLRQWRPTGRRFPAGAADDAADRSSEQLTLICAPPMLGRCPRIRSACARATSPMPSASGA